MKISIIVPCFNAAQKIGPCLSSLSAIDMDISDYEVIFVDDCSSDDTYQLLVDVCSDKTNWHAHKLPVNSGSPSRPRNFGTKIAKGNYVFYLDCDDEILPDTLRIHYEAASEHGADMVRGSLYVNDGSKRILMNRLLEWSPILDRKISIELFLGKQSLTKTCLIRTSLLIDNAIYYPEDMKMGEDTVFVADAICAATKLIYIDHPTYIYNRMPTFVQSTTQSFGEKELSDQLLMWPRLQKIFLKEDINYFSTRLHVNLSYIFSLLIKNNRFDIKESTFKRFSDFIRSAANDLNRRSFSGRHLELLCSIENEDFDKFCKLARPRLLIAGHDLKFISPFYPILGKYFDIRQDEWTGHNTHDEAKSLECLEWAECIWCEWLLGNAVWYSERRKSHQRLVVRMHRFEVGLDYGFQLCIKNVDAVVAVSVLFFERLLEKFHNIPRNKARLIPLAYSLDEYESHFVAERLHTISIIGILPSGKGFDKAIKILSKLRSHDERFRLEVFGKKPEDLPWIKNDKNEIKYFNECKSLIAKENLEDVIHFNGHSDITKALAKRKIGFVLSLSLQVRELPGFESFHVAVGDGYAGGAVSLVLQFHGAEYVWNQGFILQSIDAIVERILYLSRNPEAFQFESLQGRVLVAERYSDQHFASRVKSCFEQV